MSLSLAALLHARLNKSRVVLRAGETVAIQSSISSRTTEARVKINDASRSLTPLLTRNHTMPSEKNSRTCVLRTTSDAAVLWPNPLSPTSPTNRGRFLSQRYSQTLFTTRRRFDIAGAPLRSPLRHRSLFARRCIALLDPLPCKFARWGNTGSESAYITRLPSTPHAVFLSTLSVLAKRSRRCAQTLHTTTK